MRFSAALTSPPGLIRRRAIAIGTFSLPWKYLFAVSEDMVIQTFGSQSTSSVHSQCRLPSSPSRAARMFTTRSTSGNSNRCGTSASRSFGPMSGSSLIAEKIQSMIDRNSFGDENSAPMAQEEVERVERALVERALDERVLVERELAGFAAWVLDRDVVVLERLARLAAGLLEVDLEAVLRERLLVRFAAVDRGGARRGAAVLVALFSSALTR